MAIGVVLARYESSATTAFARGSDEARRAEDANRRAFWCSRLPALLRERFNFEDTAALRKALKDRQAAGLIQAAQDILTLLSQDGIYMDDLRPDRARSEIWRRFATGERGRQIAALGGIRDRSSLALSAGRMKQDPIFRDTAHHFLRRFDKMLAEFCESASDADIADLSDTRTARAFMLLGRVTGMFD